MRTVWRTLTIVLVAGVAASGCGQDGAAATASAVSDRFMTAVESGDGELACAQLTPEARAALESQEQRQCREAVTELRLESGSVTRVRVYALNAMVELSSGEAEFLEQGEQGWRLSAVGCEPQAGMPADRPYDCRLED
jgi:hypothetical protein